LISGTGVSMPGFKLQEDSKYKLAKTLLTVINEVKIYC